MAPLNNLEIVDFCDNSSTFEQVEKTFPLHCATKKQVSISFSVEQHDVLHVFDYTVEEIRATWYSPAELKEVKAAARDDVKKMTRGENDPEDGSWCSRGLESRTKNGRMEKSQSRLRSKDAVFMEQDIQYEAGSYNPEAIADAYHRLNGYCQAVAEMSGVLDAREANKLYALTKHDSFRHGYKPVQKNSGIMHLITAVKISSIRHY